MGNMVIARLRYALHAIIKFFLLDPPVSLYLISFFHILYFLLMLMKRDKVLTILTILSLILLILDNLVIIISMHLLLILPRQRVNRCPTAPGHLTVLSSLSLTQISPPTPLSINHPSCHRQICHHQYPTHKVVCKYGLSNEYVE